MASKYMSAQAMVLEGLDDYSRELSDAIALPLVAAFAAQEPAWVREARASYYADDDFDWGYEEWKWERDTERANAEWLLAQAVMDDDGGPVYADHFDVFCGLA